MNIAKVEKTTAIVLAAIVAGVNAAAALVEIPSWIHVVLSVTIAIAAALGIQIRDNTSNTSNGG